MRSVFFSSRQISLCYFLILCLGIGFLSGFRSAPVYGKLDFLLIDSTPWWPEWRPMIEDVLRQGKQPVYTDPMTSAVLKGVFGQKTVLFRNIARYHTPILYVNNLEIQNEPRQTLLPVGALMSLLGSDMSSKRRINQVLVEYLNEKKKSQKGGGSAVVSSLPYRCLINVHGFAPTWVPRETGHWMPYLADTKWFYRYNNVHVADIISELKSDPPENCTVFF